MLRTSGAMSLKTRRSPPQSCKDVIWEQGHLLLIFLEKNFFEKVIEKEHFGVILRIVKPKHLPPPTTKNVYSSNCEKKILHDFPVFCSGGLCEKGEILKIFGHGRIDSRGSPGADISSKSSLSIYRRKIF